jgi:hypothetical protein
VFTLIISGSYSADPAGSVTDCLSSYLFSVSVVFALSSYRIACFDEVAARLDVEGQEAVALLLVSSEAPAVAEAHRAQGDFGGVQAASDQKFST